MLPPERPDFLIVDGVKVKITRLPAGPMVADLRFDRYQHDNAGLSPEATRSEALANKEFGASLWADGRRTRIKPTE